MNSGQLKILVGVGVVFGGKEGEGKLEIDQIDQCLPFQWVTIRLGIWSRVRPAELIPSKTLAF